jgi:thioredoxin 1
MGISPRLALLLALLGSSVAQTLPAPSAPIRNLYPPNANAKHEIREALLRASRENKRVLLVFGGDWCYDCHVLENAFRSPEIKPLLDANYRVVHVDIGRGEKNLDIAQRYETNVEGVPSMAVLAADGTLLFGDAHHHFSAARRVQEQELIAFLNKWKPGKRNP